MSAPGRKRRPVLLAQASAYFRLAAKADRSGNPRQAANFRAVAERKVEQNRRNVEAIKSR